MPKKRKSSVQLDEDKYSQLQIPNICQELNTKSQQLITVGQSDKQARLLRVTLQPQPYMYQQNSSAVTQINESQDDNQTYQKSQLQMKNQQAQMIKLAHNKMIIGGGFSLDMNDFFKFKAKKIMQFPGYHREGEGLSQYITGGHWAWIILLYSVCNGAIMPAWIMSIKANKILRISWRFLLQAIFMIPFILHEKRTGKESDREKYTLKHVLKPQGLRKVYLSSIGTSIWFTIILTCFEWTYISHALVFGSLSNFFLSLSRSYNNSTHSLQPGGQIFVIVGIIFSLFDTYFMKVEQLPHSVWNVINPYYLNRQTNHRILADLAALSAAFILSKFSQKTANLKSYYPPFLSMFMVNISVSFHVVLSAYFINGATFDRDSNFGVFGLFTGDHFAGFLYMAVILSIGTYLSYTVISRLFANPVIPALVMTLEPFFATFFLNLVGVQSMPGSFTIFGYIFVICGLFLILIGQFLLQREKQTQKTYKQLNFGTQLNEKFIKHQIIEELQEQHDEQNQTRRKQLHYNKCDIPHYALSETAHR